MQGIALRVRVEPCALSKLTEPALLDAAAHRGAVDEDEIVRAALVWVSDFARPIQVIVLPARHAAALTWGATVEWTSADGVEDAIERYFGGNGKALEEPRAH